MTTTAENKEAERFFYQILKLSKILLNKCIDDGNNNLEDAYTLAEVLNEKLVEFNKGPLPVLLGIPFTTGRERSVKP